MAQNISPGQNPVHGITGALNPANAHLYDHPDRPPGKTVYCHSSNVRSFAYVGAGSSDWLDVEFNSGDLYRYYGVPWSVYWGMVAASSKGKYVWQVLRANGYQYAKL